MGAIKFRELTWEDLETPTIMKDWLRAQRYSWLFVGIALLVMGAIVALFYYFVLSADAKFAHYAQQYPWLNKCSITCASKTNVAYLDQLTSCEVFDKLYTRPPVSHFEEWLLAINDRAASFECVGFPKSVEQVTADAIAMRTSIKEAEELAQLQRQEQLQQEIANRVPRFKNSLIEGRLAHIFEKSELDLTSDSHMILYVSLPRWLSFQVAMREQLANVAWQKWAQIYNPDKPDNARLSIYTVEGSIYLGGSPSNKGRPITLTDPGNSLHAGPQ